MEFSIVESSLLECITHIKECFLWNSRQDTITDTSCILQVKKIYNSCHPILCEFLPNVLSYIITEYVNESFNIDITVEYSQTCPRCTIIVINKELHIYHSHLILFPRTKIFINHVYIKCIDDIETDNKINVPREHIDIMNYYMKQYNPTKKQMCIKCCHDSKKNHWNYIQSTNAIISHIKDREQFDNECTIMISLVNNLHNFVL